MGLYIYSNPSNPDEIVEIVQSIHDKHEFIKNGIKWDRNYTVPTAAVDSKIDPMNSRDFADKTGKKRGTVGDLWNASAEASEKREKIMGRDEVKISYEKKEKARRKGKTLPSEIAANRNKTFEI